MSNWRQVILQKFIQQTSSLIYVEDFDGLLNEEQLLNELISLGYEVVRYEDSIAFRYLFETKYRGQESSLKLLLYANEDIYFPYVFRRNALRITINIETIFPKFSAKVLRAMNREDFSTLYRLHEYYDGPQTEVATLDFIVKRFYKIPYDLVDSEIDLYKALLSIHGMKDKLPEIVSYFLFEKWRAIDAFSAMSLRKMIFSSSAFYHYLGEKWASFVKEILMLRTKEKDTTAIEKSTSPFTNRDIRHQMHGLFLEGILKQVDDVDSTELPEWMEMGVVHRNREIGAATARRDYLINKLDESLEEISTYKDWFRIVEYIAELKRFTSVTDDLLRDALHRINRNFYGWMKSHYHSLVSLPPFPNPKLVNHIPHNLSRMITSDERIALIVMDGMSYSQWVIIREYLKEKKLYFEDDMVFAWVPTLTSVSRQAIFSGKIPLHFANSIATTMSEKKLWGNFWEEKGVVTQYVAYQKSLGRETYNWKHIEGLNRKSIKVYGAVIDIIDRFIHSAVLGEKSLLSNLQLWLETNYLENLLLDLQNSGFTVYLTSDHGNTTATGIGRVSEGVLVDQRGERVRIYRDGTLYKDALDKIQSVQWSNIGLPEDYYALLAENGQAFVPKGEHVVTHGGISVEEVIVPFVKMMK